MAALGLRDSGHYLGGSFNGGSVLQQKFNDFDSILLARYVERRETVLGANKQNLPLSASLTTFCN